MTGPRGDLAPEVGGLGRKVPREKPELPEWVKTDNPRVRRNVKTGRLETYGDDPLPLPIVIDISF